MSGMAVVMEGSEDNGAAGGKDNDSGAAEVNVDKRHERSWLVTDTGRVKMVHPYSKRDVQWSRWDSKDPQDQTSEEPMNLITCQGPFDPTFAVNVVLDADGQSGFDVNEQTLAVANVDSRFTSCTPMMDGDIITKVNDVRVENFQEYVDAIKSGPAFRLSLSPGQDGHVGHETWDDRGLMAVEFTKAEVIAPEDAGTVQVGVRRAGDTHLRLEWGWSIRNGSVVEKFFKKLQPRGTIVFEEGMAYTSLEVEIPRDPTWNAEAIYSISLDPTPLSMPSDTKVMLGNQFRLRVYSINQVSFPSGIYGKIGDPVQREPPVWEIVCGFWMHNYDEIPFATKMGIFLSLLPPFLHYFKQMTWEVLINCGLVGLRPDQECMVWDAIDISSITGSPAGVLWFVAVAWVVFAVLHHIIHVRFRMQRLGGQTTMKLRANIFTTMLQLSEEAKESFDEGDVCKVLDNETRHATEHVWMPAFECLQILLNLCVRTLLCIQVALKLPTQTAVILLLSIPLMLCCMLVALRLRRDTELEARHQAYVADENWNAFVIMSNLCHPLILTYRKGWMFTEQFNECHKAFNKKNYAANVVSSNTLWMVQYVFVFIVVVVIILGGHAVQSKDLLVGGLLILFNAVEGFGKDLHSLAKILNSFVSGSAAVKKIGHVLNAQTRRQERIKKAENASSEIIDEGQIILKEVSYGYPNAQRGVTKAVPMMNLSIPAGSFVCFPEGVGNVGFNTLFCTMSGMIVPPTGRVLIPCQWRIVYVPVVPILFDGTLMYNLLFGDQGLLHSELKTRESVWNICRALGMSPELLQNDDYDVGSSGCCLKFSDMVIVSITRALTHHADLLLISSALDVLGQSRAVKVLRYLRGYTKHRGLPGERLPQALRHHKTVLYTTKYRMLHEQATHHIMLQEHLTRELDVTGVQSI